MGSLKNRVHLLIAAGAVCLVGAWLGISAYIDRLNCEREYRASVEAQAAAVLSFARKVQDEVTGFRSGMDSAIAKVEDHYSSATNEMAILSRGRWANEKIRQILVETESELARDELKIAAALEVKARVTAALERIVADLAEIEGMSLTNEATLNMALEREGDCLASFYAIKRSPDIEELVKFKRQFNSTHFERIVFNARRRIQIVLNSLPRR